MIINGFDIYLPTYINSAELKSVFCTYIWAKLKKIKIWSLRITREKDWKSNTMFSYYIIVILWLNNDWFADSTCMLDRNHMALSRYC